MPKRKPQIVATFEHADAIEEFLDGYRYGSPKTFANYRGHLYAVRDFLLGHGIVDLTAITPAHIRQWLVFEANRPKLVAVGGRNCRQYREEGNISPTFLEARYSHAQTFFNWCIAQDYLEISPADKRKVRRPPVPKPMRHGFTAEETSRLIRHASEAIGWLGSRDRAIIMFLLGTGARADELLSVRLDHCRRCNNGPCISKDMTRLTLHGKGDKDREARIGSRLRQSIKQYLRARPPVATDHLWVNQRNVPLTYGALAAMLGNLGSWAGVSDCTAHRFRHTYAAEHYRKHRDIIAVKQLLGHTKIAVTERYLASLGVNYGIEKDYASPDEWLGS